MTGENRFLRMVAPLEPGIEVATRQYANLASYRPELMVNATLPKDLR